MFFKLNFEMGLLMFKPPLHVRLKSFTVRLKSLERRLKSSEGRLKSFKLASNPSFVFVAEIHWPPSVSYQSLTYPAAAKGARLTG